jgi:hypothetical protein
MPILVKTYTVKLKEILTLYKIISINIKIKL